MECPVCEGPAEVIEAPGGVDVTDVDCQICEHFQIARTVRNRLARLDKGNRIVALDKAKAWAARGERPMVTSHSF
jgi:hypothetical protein